ncbi:MAG: glutamine synthetase family protein [Pseudomonadota bacterium]
MFSKPPLQLPCGSICQSEIFNEWQDFFDQNKKIKTIDLIFYDLSGQMRGKTIPAYEWQKCVKGQVMIPGSSLVLDHQGAALNRIEEGFKDGDPDHFCWPVKGSLIHFSPGKACALVSIFDAQKPIFCDGYGMVMRLLERLKASGLYVQIAIELEFYLLDMKSVYDGKVELAHTPDTRCVPKNCQVYHIETLSDYDQFFDGFRQFMSKQSIDIGALTKEYGPNQFEINLNHSSDVLSVIRDAILFKHCLRMHARKHGWLASFAAKPLEDYAGSGLHIHCSIWDQKGKNLGVKTNDKTKQHCISDLLRYAIGGLQATIDPSMVIFASDMNAYRRLQPGSYAPINKAWGYNNRAVSLRIPAGNPKATRIEHRVAAANANLFLAVASLLSGIHYGVNHKLDPGLPTQGIDFESSTQDIITNWWDAIAAWHKFEPWIDYFGQRFHDRFWHINRHNLDLFINETRGCDTKLYFPYF